MQASTNLIVPQELVKTVKDALQASGKLKKSEKIRKLSSACPDTASVSLENASREERLQGRRMYIIPTTATIRLCTGNNERPEEGIEGLKSSLIKEAGLHEHADQISLLVRPLDSSSSNSLSRKPSVKASSSSLLAQTVSRWLATLPPSLLPVPIPTLLSGSPWTYTIYPPLLLLPSHTFSYAPWPFLLATTLRPHLPTLFGLLCSALKITHVALNNHIPSSTLRTPNLTPLHGSFGPSTDSTSTPPTPTDLANAFWCTAQQNRIFQTWAPCHTMFSRGNITEKTRLLALPTLTAAGLGTHLAKISAVDLYAGIGYFAFCYAKAGAGTVLCWELSGWSVEGLRRGAAENGWSVAIISENEKSIERESFCGEKKFLVFHESNQNAASRIAHVRNCIPPVRHVNCGFLPSSAPSWETAIRALDPRLGGWVHVHENIARNRFAQRKLEIVERLRALVREVFGEEWEVECNVWTEVKGYGPGVGHWVLDVEVLKKSVKKAVIVEGVKI